MKKRPFTKGLQFCKQTGHLFLKKSQTSDSFESPANELPRSRKACHPLAAFGARLDDFARKKEKQRKRFQLLLARHFSLRGQLCGSYRMASNGRRVPGDIRMRVMGRAVRCTKIVCLVLLTAVILQRSPTVTFAEEEPESLVTGE